MRLLFCIYFFEDANKKVGAGGPDRVGAVPEKLTINFMQPYII